MNKYNITQSQIWKSVETGSKTVEPHKAVLSGKEKRQVGVSSAERGELMTVLPAIHVEARFLL